MTEPLISIFEAAARGIDRVRKPIWANQLDHLKIDIVSGGGPGPWCHLYCPFNLECNGRDPVDFVGCLESSYDEKEWVPYTGPLPESDEYKKVQKMFEGALSK